MGVMRNLVLAQAVSELASLLDYAGKRNEASELRGEVAPLASGRGARGLDALRQANRIRSGVALLGRVRLAEDERARADEITARIQRVMAEPN
jgi:hypothetical protein